MHCIMHFSVNQELNAKVLFLLILLVTITVIIYKKFSFKAT